MIENQDDVIQVTPQEFSAVDRTSKSPSLIAPVLCAIVYVLCALVMVAPLNRAHDDLPPTTPLAPLSPRRSGTRGASRLGAG